MTQAEWNKAARFCRMTVPQYKAHLKATRPHLLQRLAEAKARKQPGYSS
jgi:hypothetical protein